MSQKIRPYIALDLETTGLDVENVNILQIGWVIEDGESPLDQLEKGSIFIKNPLITHGEAFALGMNAWIFEQIKMSMEKKATKYPVVTLEEGLFQFAMALSKAAALAEKWDVKNGLKPRKKVQVCGKNPANFDFPIVVNNLKRAEKRNSHNLSISVEHYLTDTRIALQQVDHRFVDVGGVFYSDFGRNPGFDEISKLVGMPPINHDALDDAMACVIAIRHRMAGGK